MESDDRVDETFAKTLRTLGSRPAVRVLIALERGPQRLAEISSANATIGEDDLASAIRDLDRAGLLVRRVDPGPPLRVLYELTESGVEITPALGRIATWAEGAR